MKHNVRHVCNWLHETNTRPVPRQRKQQAARRRGAIGLVVVLVLLLQLILKLAMRSLVELHLLFIERSLCSVSIKL